MASDQNGAQNEGSENVKRSDMMSDPKATENEDDHDEQAGADIEGKPKKTEPLGLLDLPGEIRNKIYRLVLVTTHSICPVDRFIYSLDPPALTLVNKQIHAEALPIYYTENHFYLMLWGSLGFHPDGDHTQFQPFTRMMEYFGRQTTSPTDRSPMRYIKNIVVQIKTFGYDDPVRDSRAKYYSRATRYSRATYYSHVYSTILDDTVPPSPTGPKYSRLCIRGEQQRMTFTATDEEPFDLTGYFWFTAGAHPTTNLLSAWHGVPHFLCSLKEAYDLLEMSFAGRVQPIDEAIVLAYEFQRRQKIDECWPS